MFIDGKDISTLGKIISLVLQIYCLAVGGSWKILCILVFWESLHLPWVGPLSEDSETLQFQIQFWTIEDTYLANESGTGKFVKNPEPN